MYDDRPNFEFGFNDGRDFDTVFLPIGEYPVVLKDAELVDGMDWKTQQTIPNNQIKWTFESLRPVTVQGKEGPITKPGIVTYYTGIKYSPAQPGRPVAKITTLLDSFFGRSLTRADVQRIDLFKLPGVVKGYVAVKPHESKRRQDGTPIGTFSYFRPADKIGPVKIEDVLKDNEPPVQVGATGVMSGGDTYVAPQEKTPLQEAVEEVFAGSTVVAEEPLFAGGEIEDPFNF